jgi:hypothetical protein
MHFPVPHHRLQLAPEPPADVRMVSNADVQWDRPVFKAPPIQLNPKVVDATSFAEDLRRIGLVGR